MTDNPERIDASMPGVLSVGSGFRLISLGANRFIVLYDAGAELTIDQFEELEADFKQSLGSEFVTLIVSNRVKEATYAPLSASEDLRKLIADEVARQLRDSHWQGDL